MSGEQVEININNGPQSQHVRVSKDAAVVIADDQSPILIMHHAGRNSIFGGCSGTAMRAGAGLGSGALATAALLFLSGGYIDTSLIFGGLSAICALGVCCIPDRAQCCK